MKDAKFDKFIRDPLEDFDAVALGGGIGEVRDQLVDAGFVGFTLVGAFTGFYYDGNTGDGCYGGHRGRTADRLAAYLNCKQETILL